MAAHNVFLRAAAAFAAACLLLGSAFALPGVAAAVAATASGTASAGLFFDDFSYPDTAGLLNQGWAARSKAGHPGVPGAQWDPAQLRMVADPTQPGNRLLRLQAVTDGTGAGTRQVQLCHARKYLEGTYAARVRFSDTPVRGADGDPVIQTFYVVSPLQFDLDPEFSELDFEYLPNGGWGSDKTRLYGITWQTARIEPWLAYNQSHEEFTSVDGWHVLMLQVAGGKTRHYLDGRLLAEHGGRSYPVVPMSINFNLWFSPGELLAQSAEPRVYEQDVDWVFHARQKVLSPRQVLAEVRRLRAAGVTQVDTVPVGQPALPSPCDF
ncbi:glycoside hydrolase family 16 protein [Roseateles koreensis]|uniref:Glycoside hydrolase family 16 protein n=1 Tax=Roseateles koreensis TaxID=2987526 RepID=A0ABT5KT79_9BURK|nr:glycoside hydrolase family 16 protein [Roseateles koreensis]MDC8785061.1 glycoside hydrolase family 16 protein [Roseateles koreensis]